MAEMTGVELAAVVGRDSRAIPVLLISGRGATGAGYHGKFLPKPFTADALLDAVNELVPISRH